MFLYLKLDMGGVIELKRNSCGFILVDSLVGLLLITTGVTLFCSNQYFFEKQKNKLIDTSDNYTELVNKGKQMILDGGSTKISKFELKDIKVEVQE